MFSGGCNQRRIWKIIVATPLWAHIQAVLPYLADSTSVSTKHILVFLFTRIIHPYSTVFSSQVNEAVTHRVSQQSGSYDYYSSSLKTKQLQDVWLQLYDPLSFPLLIPGFELKRRRQCYLNTASYLASSLPCN